MRLNGWQRIGIISSVLWGIGGAIYERSGQLRFAKDLLELSINHCSPSDAEACLKLAYKTHAELIVLDSSAFQTSYLSHLPQLLSDGLLLILL